jgi:hypothetical protein
LEKEKDTMSIIDFESIVKNSTLRLTELGYQFQNETSLYAVEFWKIPFTGVYCLIGFDLFESSVLPYKFKILLIRRRLEDFTDDESRYSPLYFDMRNLMLRLHRIDIFPSNQYAWEFIDETSLINQVLNAQSFVVEYGINWLEDPKSNINWSK